MSKLCGFKGLLGAVIVKPERASAGDVGKDYSLQRRSNFYLCGCFFVCFCFAFVFLPSGNLGFNLRIKNKIKKGLSVHTPLKERKKKSRKIEGERDGEHCTSTPSLNLLCARLSLIHRAGVLLSAHFKLLVYFLMFFSHFSPVPV